MHEENNIIVKYVVLNCDFQVSAYDFRTRFIPNEVTPDEMRDAAYRSGNFYHEGKVIGEYETKEEALSVLFGEGTPVSVYKYNGFLIGDMYGVDKVVYTIDEDGDLEYDDNLCEFEFDSKWPEYKAYADEDEEEEED